MTWMKAVRIIVALTLLSGVTVPLLASRTDQYERYYYTDASYTEECGGALVFCDGATYWGCYDSPYYIDYELPSCSTPGDNSSGSATYSNQCSDGIDNDRDGKTDMADPQCARPPYFDSEF